MKLENNGEHFEKLVELPSSKEKIFYKVHHPTAALFSALVTKVPAITTKLGLNCSDAIVFHILTLHNLVESRIPSPARLAYFRCKRKGSLLGDKATLLTPNSSFSRLPQNWAELNLQG